VAVAWDRYDGGAYDVHCRLRLSSGEWLPPARVSAGPGNALCPQLGVGEDGSVFCCWVAAEDVADSRGILDQHHRVRCARLTGGQWLPTGDGEEGTVADLAHGLLPRRAIWGYLGRRRRPFFRRDERGRLWLLWERKTDPDAETREGELLGRAYVGDRWDPPVRLAEGFAYYVVEETAAGSAPQWLARRAAWGRAAWDLQVTRGAVLRARPGDGAAPATEPGDWRDWRPTALPEALALPTAPPPVTIGDEDYDLYFGDLHAHTTLSADAEGEVDELYHYARDKACLDFVALVDNDCYQCPMTASEFEVAMTCAELYDDPGRFVALRGYEWTRWDRERESHPDHRTVLFPADGDIFRHVDAGTPANSDLAREVEARGGLLLSQHWDWTLTDGAAEAGLEVCSAWDYYVDRPGPFHRELVAARRLAFIGGSDSHRRNPGTGGALTGVYARELTRAGIFEALRARRVYATSGSRIALDFRVNGTPMGGEVACSGAPVLTVSVRGTRPLRSLAVVRGVVGGAVEEVQPVRVQTLAGETAEVRWADESCPSATVFYYVIARQEGEDVRYPSNLVVAQGCRAWSSPTWVRRG